MKIFQIDFFRGCKKYFQVNWFILLLSENSKLPGLFNKKSGILVEIYVVKKRVEFSYLSLYFAYCKYFILDFFLLCFF